MSVKEGGAYDAVSQVEEGGEGGTDVRPTAVCGRKEVAKERQFLCAQLVGRQATLHRRLLQTCSSHSLHSVNTSTCSQSVQNSPSLGNEISKFMLVKVGVGGAVV